MNIEYENMVTREKKMCRRRRTGADLECRGFGKTYL